MPLVSILSGSVGLLICVVMMYIVLKGASASKEQRCPKDQWATVIRNFGTGYPKDFHLEIGTENGSALAGEFCEQKYFWIFPTTPKNGALQPNMTFHRNWINARYVVSVKPASDVIVKIS